MTTIECTARIACLKADALYHEGLLARTKKEYAKACGKFSAALSQARSVFWSGFVYNGRPVSDLMDRIRKAHRHATQLRDKK